MLKSWLANFDVVYWQDLVQVMTQYRVFNPQRQYCALFLLIQNMKYGILLAHCAAQNNARLILLETLEGVGFSIYQTKANILPYFPK